MTTSQEPIDVRSVGPLVRSRTGLFVSLAIGAVGLGGTFAAISADPKRAMHAYLASYIFFLGIALGSLGWLLTFHAGRSRWAVLVRRPLEVNSATFPILALLSLPIFMNLPQLYEWANNPAAGTGDAALLGFRAIYLSRGFVYARAAGYFGFWILISTCLYRWSRLQDQRPTELIYTVRSRFWSAAALPPLALTMAFAGIDWVMSLRAGWISTMFGFYVIAGAILSAMALFAIQAAWLQHSGKLPGRFTHPGQHNIGKLLFAFTIFWAYIAFSQFLLIWIGNLHEELPWMLQRTTTGWQPVAYCLLWGHFALPFALLLPVTLKMRPQALAAVAVIVLLGCFLDDYWLVLPHLQPNGPDVSWMDLAAFLGIGGTSAAFWFFQAGRSAAAPVGDQYIRDSMIPSHG